MEKIKDLNNFKLIFSAHGLPEKNIKKGDPYQWQTEQTVKKIMDEIKNVISGRIIMVGINTTGTSLQTGEINLTTTDPDEVQKEDEKQEINE